MNDALRLPFSPVASALGEAGFSPLLPLILTSDRQTIQIPGTLDTGASVNVLPWQAGLSLKLDWDSQNIPIRLTGNLANFEARAVLLLARVSDFPPIQLAFAWTMAEQVPLLLGQTNFFMEFDVCFFRSRMMFEVKQKSV